MSRTLTFSDAAWASARECAAAGRRAAALTHLAPLIGSPDTPPGLRLLAHRLAARVHFAGEAYRKSRQHLHAAERLAPANAEVHYELGLAFERDPYGCDERAARRFRRAVRLAPTEAKYVAALGRALVRVNRVRAGVKRLTQAAGLGPDSSAVWKVVVEGLCDAGRAEDAARALAKARFLAPADKKLARLWDDVKYALACEGQPRPKAVRGPRVLPFMRVAGGTVRRDAASRPAPHLGRLRAYRG